MQSNELEEIKKYIKKTAKSMKKEGSTTAGAPGFLSAKAFVGDEDAEGSQKGMAAGAPYTSKAPEKKPHFVKLHEISYKTFKEDSSKTDVQKINTAILEINRRIREINKILDHSIKLKNESQMADAKLWKKTNEALVKISHRMSEAAKKTKKFANLKEIQSNQVKERMQKLLATAGINVQLNDIEVEMQDGGFVIDAYINGEPYGFDLQNNILSYQDWDKEIELGLFSKDDQIIAGIKKVLK